MQKNGILNQLAQYCINRCVAAKQITAANISIY